MKIVLGLGALALLAGCAGTGALPGGDTVGTNTAFREFMVIGSSMPFEECRARGGFIIRDVNSPMTACDPTVRRNPVPQEALDDPLTDTDLNAALEQQDLDAVN
ncbi:MAG: hypothetical protein ACI9U6_003116 [Loktanella salsilacus]|jgi:hypothetical protein|uniref:hypothetical protein n=1 Tax=Loktanella salsilacus TaxID=195913 RepID=UPI00398920F1